MGKWNRSAPVLTREKVEEQRTEVVISETVRALEERGWALWRCWSLGGDIIVVIRDEMVSEVPEKYPIYTAAELETLADEDAATIRLVHEAKKAVRAWIESGNGLQRTCKDK